MTRARGSWRWWADNDVDAARASAQRLAQFVRVGPLLMLAHVLACGLAAVAIGPRGGVGRVAWLVLSAVGLAVGAVAWWRLRRVAVDGAARRGEGLVTAHAALLGLGWGSAAMLWLPQAAGVERELLAALLAAMLGVGAVVLTVSPRAGLLHGGLVAAGCVGAVLQPGAAAGPLGMAVAALFAGYAAILSGAVVLQARWATKRLKAQHMAAREQQAVAQLLRDFEENASDALWQTDAEGRLVHRSARLAALFEVPVEQLGEIRLPQWFSARAQVSGAAVLAAWALGRPFRDLKLQIGRGQNARWWAISAKPVAEAEGAGGGGWRGVIADITEAQRFEQQLRLQAEQDTLTGLANRRALMNAAQAALSLGRTGWLLSIDLDHFKVVNDSSGHSAGDEVLRVVSGRLLALAEEGDIIGRLGGDEFAMLRLGQSPVRAPQAMAALIIEKLSQPIQIGPKRLHVGASVGVARLDPGVAHIEDLMVNADLALYDAKRSGRGRCVVYANPLGAASRRMHTVEQALREGLAQQQFELHFQPKVDARSLQPLGVEALMRWEHPVLGSISPGEFIPAAERCGLIFELGALALQQACLAARELPGLGMAVNVSALQLMEPGYVESVERILARTRLAPALLQLEVTESLMMEDAQAAFSRLHALRELGVQVALDDFGTGYSSLAYLRAFPFRTLKIDRSFVRALNEHADARAIVHTIVQMAGVLGMRTVAEGVETQRELGMVRDIGCDEVQGYLIARPMPLPKLQDWLAGRPVTGPVDKVDSRVQPWRHTQPLPPTTAFGTDL